ncbi:hypothetical protein GGQ84_000726 [Desulfitispora alkaliphila]|uniref:cache domain-containing protein n=1 Tax=Desulfitispora alkaliphila TaxID=622674 RepID=UPI003D1C7DCB
MFKTIKSKLLLYFLGLFVVLIILVGFFSYQNQKEVLKNHLEKNSIIFGDTMAAAIEQIIAETLANTNYMAKNPVIRDPQSTFDELEREFEHFLNSYNMYFGVILVDHMGTVIADTSEGELIGNDFSNRRWFKEAIQNEIYMSDVYLSPAVKRPLLVLGEIVEDQQGQLIGVVSPSFNLRHLWQKIESFTERQQDVGLSGYAFLINGNGDVIAHPDYSKILTENYLMDQKLTINKIRELSECNTTYYNAKDQTINTFVKIEQIPGFNNDWYVVISVPEEELYNPLKSLLKQYLLLFGIVISVTTLIIVKFSDYIVAPIQKLVVATSEYGEGKKIVSLKRVIHIVKSKF